MSRDVEERFCARCSAAANAVAITQTADGRSRVPLCAQCYARHESIPLVELEHSADVPTISPKPTALKTVNEMMAERDMDDTKKKLPSPEEFALLLAEFATEVARMFERPSVPIQNSRFEPVRRQLLEAYEDAHRRATSDPRSV